MFPGFAFFFLCAFSLGFQVENNGPMDFDTHPENTLETLKTQHLIQFTFG